VWVEGHPSDVLKSGWKYYLEEAEQEPEGQAQLEKIRAEYRTIDPEDIKLIDPCMGSGHILVYAFDVLMQIYVSCGYTERDAAAKILENNLYGLDIDERAYQLAYFAVMMKARQYDRRFFSRGVKPNLYAPGSYAEGQEFGSLLTVDKLEPKPEPPKELTLFNMDYDDKLNTWNFRRLLAQKYDVVVTNPPYMAVSNATPKVQEYIKSCFNDNKTDFYAVFIERCGQLTYKNRYQAMITQHGWMFLTSFEKMRKQTLLKDIINMAHLGSHAFDEIAGEVVQTTSFVVRNSHCLGYRAIYHRLIDGDTENGKRQLFLDGKSAYISSLDNFSLIDGSPVAYWISGYMLKVFASGRKLGELAFPCQGMATTNNDKFLKLWFEVYYSEIKFDAKSEEDTVGNKYFPYNKGGEYRKWYGNNFYIIFFEDYGKAVCDYIDSHSAVNHKGRVINRDKYFKENFTWGALASTLSCRYSPEGFIFDTKGSSCFSFDKARLFYYLGFMNTKVCVKILELLAPTLDFNCGTLAKTPILFSPEKQNDVTTIVDNTISLSKTDWDSFETSWDFQTHPLIYIALQRGHWNSESTTIAECFKEWTRKCAERFQQLKHNEEELNRLFIDIYGLQNELSPEVEDKDVTVHFVADTKYCAPGSMRNSNYLLTKNDVIKSLISYAVGCMFGRYSLISWGLCFAGGEWDERKYKTYLPDADNCIPITDEEYFKDDIVGRFVEFIRVGFGDADLDENLDFIAGALGNKGNTSREVIRNYFLNDFFKNHCQIYQKRPIYWLFDSGKQNGFKALVYMHRWNADTVGNVRVEYLHRVQRVYEKEIERMQETIDNSRNAREVAAAEKRKEKLTKQLKEAKDYDTKIAHIALSRIDIDLDDGVKVNYEKVQTAQDGKKIEILAKI
jgi:hypothetical protein